MGTMTKIIFCMIFSSLFILISPVNLGWTDDKKDTPSEKSFSWK